MIVTNLFFPVAAHDAIFVTTSSLETIIMSDRFQTSDLFELPGVVIYANITKDHPPSLDLIRCIFSIE
jgi:hypothetical protein